MSDQHMPKAGETYVTIAITIEGSEDAVLEMISRVRATVGKHRTSLGVRTSDCVEEGESRVR